MRNLNGIKKYHIFQLGRIAHHAVFSYDGISSDKGTMSDLGTFINDQRREPRKPGEFRSRDDKPREFRPRDSKPREFGSREDRPRGEFKPREFRKDGDRERKPFDRERRPGGNGEFKPKREFKPRKREEGE